MKEEMHLPVKMVHRVGTLKKKAETYLIDKVGKYVLGLNVTISENHFGIVRSVHDDINAGVLENRLQAKKVFQSSCQPAFNVWGLIYLGFGQITFQDRVGMGTHG